MLLIDKILVFFLVFGYIVRIILLIMLLYDIGSTAGTGLIYVLVSMLSIALYYMGMYMNCKYIVIASGAIIIIYSLLSFVLHPVLNYYIIYDFVYNLVLVLFIIKNGLYKINRSNYISLVINNGIQ